jgi:hypothetical protein
MNNKRKRNKKQNLKSPKEKNIYIYSEICDIPIEENLTIV